MEAKTLAELRRQQGLTQRQLAKALGLRPSTIAMYELGLRTPSLETAKQIAQFFGVVVESIYFGNDARRMRVSTGTEGH